MTPTTPDYQRRATKNYIAKNAQLALVITPEQKEDIRQGAESLGLSMTAAIWEAWKSFDWRSRTQQPELIPISEPQQEKQQAPPRSLSDLPQPPDNIPKDNRTALVIWMTSHGWHDDEIAQYFNDNTVTPETVAQLSGVPWDILKDSATLEQPPALPLPPDDIAAAPVEVLAQWLHDHGYIARQIREYLKDNRK